MSSSTTIILDELKTISGNLSEAKDSSTVFPQILQFINRHFHFSKSFIALYKSGLDKLQLTSGEGFSVSEFRRFNSQLENSIFQKVFQSGNPLLDLPAIQNTTILSDFLSSEISGKIFIIGIPIKIKNEVRGVIAGFGSAQAKINLKETENFFQIIVAMISQSLHLERTISGENEKLLAENLELLKELREKYDFGHIVGNSGEMRRVYQQVSQVARTNATVLLRGESGTGKELIASAIHYNSLRSKKPFIKVNCAALPETLIESELFGYEKGAFTGATTRKKGRFELADGGTLFLDEIGDLPPLTQIKLLRVLQEREFERLGGTETVKANVRLITATNKNLEEAMAEGTFREDLYYRLNVFTIFLPPLRERKSDILLLAETFVEKYAREHVKEIKRISTPAIDMLSSYHYPGNVRELENVIERAVLVCEGNVIHGHHLPPTLQMAEASGTIMQVSLASAVETFERDLISDTLKTTRGNRAKAAKLLDTTERILCYKIKNYSIEPRRFKN